MARGDEAVAELAGYLETLLRKRRDHPTDDLLSLLAADRLAAWETVWDVRRRDQVVFMRRTP